MEQVTGIVARTNGTGFQLTERDGWLNISRYASNVQMPAAGQRVRVALDRAGFVRRIERADAAPDAINGHSARANTPDALQARIAALRAATAIVARQPGALSVQNVISAAERLEGWLTR
jgi:hypothetical protein